MDINNLFCLISEKELNAISNDINQLKIENRDDLLEENYYYPSYIMNDDFIRKVERAKSELEFNLIKNNCFFN